ncbi:hypothetical protein CEXT_136561 [Caerostris extrusa]|uniref:Uncharacterized protein n=1 Tax=Caerostris extrusa TaxID=172846 RepID=A0AAV4X822_CAEEX|nr:hypothetical protein CEXT_136561 [Caerostris extrusa]
MICAAFLPKCICSTRTIQNPRELQNSFFYHSKSSTKRQIEVGAALFVIAQCTGVGNLAENMTIIEKTASPDRCRFACLQMFTRRVGSYTRIRCSVSSIAFYLQWGQNDIF